jgi:hypothetical protein
MEHTYRARLWPRGKAPFEVTVQAAGARQARDIIEMQYGSHVKIVWVVEEQKPRKAEVRSATPSAPMPNEMRAVAIGIFAALTALGVLYAAYDGLMGGKARREAE